LKENIEKLKLEADQAERSGDYGKVAELRYGKIKEAEEKLAAFNGQMAPESKGSHA
jgi:ATP-dependent Clp protease ATP-binding subunit ClpB